jgi:hypothetical protein
MPRRPGVITITEEPARPGWFPREPFVPEEPIISPITPGIPPEVVPVGPAVPSRVVPITPITPLRPYRTITEEPTVTPMTPEAPDLYPVIGPGGVPYQIPGGVPAFTQYWEPFPIKGGEFQVTREELPTEYRVPAEVPAEEPIPEPAMEPVTEPEPAVEEAVREEKAPAERPAAEIPLLIPPYIPSGKTELPLEGRGFPGSREPVIIRRGKGIRPGAIVVMPEPMRGADFMELIRPTTPTLKAIVGRTRPLAFKALTRERRKRPSPFGGAQELRAIVGSLA